MPVNAVQRRAVMPQPAYPMTASGIPVNGTDGLLRTESRGIHIKGLNYMCTERDLQGLLSSYGGHPTSIVLPREGRSAKCKGWATAEFATKEEAQIAVSRLNQAQHMGKVVSVRHDKDAASVQGPVIANGSTIKVSAAPPRIARRH
jgi:RNA recognition motif-containing protein